ncbi:MAG: hypothetical protein Q6L54_03955 [Gloeomargarita sp. HHBFW_bins_205]
MVTATEIPTIIQEREGARLYAHPWDDLLLLLAWRTPKIPERTPWPVTALVGMGRWGASKGGNSLGA